MPETRRPSTRVAVTGAVVAVVIIVAIIIIATNGDDSDSTSSATTTTNALVIQSPATVTGITGVTGASDKTNSTDGSTTTVGANTYPLVRTLGAAGTFDCTTLGSWQPFAEIQLAVSVGEPAANLTCGDRVLDLPEGYCTPTCSEVPADWSVVEDPDVTPQALMLIVAPTTADATAAQFMCIKDFVPQVKQILPAATSIGDACASTTSNSVEIPYVPQPTSDIPYVPPPVSVDIPGSTG